MRGQKDARLLGRAADVVEQVRTLRHPHQLWPRRAEQYHRRVLEDGPQVDSVWVGVLPCGLLGQRVV